MDQPTYQAPAPQYTQPAPAAFAAKKPSPLAWILVVILLLALAGLGIFTFWQLKSSGARVAALEQQISEKTAQIETLNTKSSNLRTRVILLSDIFGVGIKGESPKNVQEALAFMNRLKAEAAATNDAMIIQQMDEAINNPSKMESFMAYLVENISQELSK